MLNLSQENGKTYTKLRQLSRWERNPKFLMKEDHDRLVEQVLDLGQYKPLLVLGEDVNVKGDTIPSGTIVGGNSRFLVYEELSKKGQSKYDTVWVSVLGFKLEEKSGLWYPIINDEVQDRRGFSDPLQIIIEYSQSDNDQAGKTDRQALAELVMPYHEIIPMQNYKIQVYDQQPLQKLLDEFQGDKEDVRPDSKAEKEEEATNYFIVKYTPEQYKEAEPRIKQVKELMNVTNNTDLFNQLLDFYLLEQDNDTN